MNLGSFQQVKWIFGGWARRIDTAPGRAPNRHWKHLSYEALGEPIFYAEIMKYVEFNRLQGDYAEFGVYQGTSFISSYNAAAGLHLSQSFTDTTYVTVFPDVARASAEAAAALVPRKRLAQDS